MVAALVAFINTVRLIRVQLARCECNNYKDGKLCLEMQILENNKLAKKIMKLLLCFQILI